MLGRVLVFSMLVMGGIGGRVAPAHAADVPPPLETAILKAKTLKDFYQRLKFSEADIKVAADIVGRDFLSPLPTVRKDKDGAFTFTTSGQQIRLQFGARGSHEFTVDNQRFEVRATESLGDALKRNLAQARGPTAYHHPWSEIFLPRAHAFLPLVGAAVVAIIGTGGYIFYEKYSATEAACDEFNTAVNSCNEPLRQLAALIRKCRKTQKPELERQLRRAEQRVRHAETRGNDPQAAARARAELKTLSDQMALNENPANPAPCTLTDDEREEDAFTGAESAASGVYWEVLSKIQNRGARGSTRMMCANERRAMSRCVEQLKKAGTILNMEFMVDRVREAPAAPNEGRD